MKRRFPDYMNYAISLGLTTVVDHACCDWLGAHLTAADRPNLAVASTSGARASCRCACASNTTTATSRDQSDIHSATARIANATQGLGDDMYKAVRFGEQVIQGGATDEEVYTVYQRIADAGWALSQHTIGMRRSSATSRSWSAWPRRRRCRLTLDAGARFEITPDQIERLKGDRRSACRVQDHDLHPQRLLELEGRPPFKTLLASGIKMGAGTDPTSSAALNPWLSSIS
jgi:predicted amidohydrolase YtcJ